MIPVVEAGTIDGVTVLHCDAASERNAAALVFRVGRFDETLPTSGITHLVEHLTLGEKVTYSYNAQVGGAFTTFFMESPDPSDTASFVSAVCRGLAADHNDALDQEKRILRTEAASRGGAGALGTCLAERYGARGPGLVAYQEFGLQGLSWADVATWRRRWFVAGNAVLLVHGVMPAGLQISLPPGSSRPAPGLRPLPIGLPSYVQAGRGSVGLAMAARRSVATTVTLDILQQRLTHVLRRERGLSYGVRSAYEPMGSELAHAWLEADALLEQTSAVAHTMLTVFEDLAERGATDDEVRDYARRMRDAYESPSGPAVALHRQAQNLLIGAAVRQPAETLEEAGALAGRAVCGAGRELLDQMIVAAPEFAPAIHGRMPRLPQWSEQAVTGTELRSRHGGPALTVGAEGITLTAAPAQRATVRFGEVAALLRWNDGKRTLIGGDGFAVLLDPAEWADGELAVGAADAHVPLGDVVDLDSAGPSYPRDQPRSAASPRASAGPGAGQAPGAGRAGVRLRRWLPWVIRGFWVAILASGLLAMLVGATIDGGIFAVAGVIGLTGQGQLLRRQVRRLRQSRTPR